MKLFIYLTALIFLGCSASSPNIREKEERDITLHTVHWNPYIEQRIVKNMVSKIILSNKLSTNKIYTLEHISNQTLDTELHTELLRKNITLALKKYGNLQFIHYDSQKPNHHIDGYCTGAISAQMQNHSKQRIMTFWLDISCTDSTKKTITSTWKTERIRPKLKKRWRW